MMQLINRNCVQLIVVLMIAVALSACANSLQTRVSGNLGKLSSLQTVAILPVEVQSDQQMNMAKVFRQSLHANLRQSSFKLLEHYIIDGQLQKHGLMDPSKYGELDPMKFGEALGVDAVLISRINRVQKSYLLIHSSIEFCVSVEMIDTRTGEILWVAEQTESEIQGIAKIPTGITAVVLAPIYLVTNKLKLNQLTATMVDKLTSIVKNPLEADADKTFDEPKIASAWNGGSSQQPQKVYWAEVVGPEPVNNGNGQLQEPSEMLKDRLKKPVATKYARNKPKPDTKQAKVQGQN
ncbi:hypothetical protein MNBD_NITROSPINAE05-878 [hydrothermal vent metagenome]|uniref:Lipoprotein n=1 Tax=hydrothermal vent metagenome TaxID=652676 RepID=A0A3B1CWC1_9ZZZZ